MNFDERHCRLCPRGCGADRRSAAGLCRCGNLPRIARAAPHFWEEPCLSGTRGSGAVFFSGCNLGCRFCQNREISRGGAGNEFTSDRLASLFLSLQAQGVHNINLVTPTPWVPWITEALEAAWREGLWLPVVYNSGGYESLPTLRALRGYISVYLPDFKYIDPDVAGKLSGARDYPEQAKKALWEMVEQRGEAVFDDGIMMRGVIVRHLVLPGYLENSFGTLEYLRREYGDSIRISIMNQYTPMPGAEGAPDRPLTEEEYDRVLDFARRIGITNAYIQEGGTAKERFIPSWDAPLPR